MNIKEVFFYIKKNFNNDIKLKNISDNFVTAGGFPNTPPYI